MSWHVSKDGIDVVCDTEEELAVAVAVFRHIEQAKPNWIVGGPVDAELLRAQGKYPPDTVADLPPMPDVFAGLKGNHPLADRPAPLALVPPTESPDSVPNPVMPQHISLPRKQNEVLEAVILFPEGVTTNSLSTLLGVSQMVVSGRIQELKVKGLIEKLPGHKAWRATQLARRAKVVCG